MVPQEKYYKVQIWAQNYYNFNNKFCRQPKWDRQKGFYYVKRYKKMILNKWVSNEQTAANKKLIKFYKSDFKAI